MKSEGFEEKHRTVIEEATLLMNRSAKDGTRSSLHYGGEGVLIPPSNQGVCGWYGVEEYGVTPGELIGFPGGTGISEPISEKRNGERCSMSSRTTEQYCKPYESGVTAISGSGVRWGSQSARLLDENSEANE